MTRMRPPKPEGIQSSPRLPRAKTARESGPKPWARPPIPPLGDETPDQVYRAVGYALSGWEYLGMEVCGLFDTFIGIELDNHASHRAYGAVTSWSTRKEMVTAASDAYFFEFHNPGLQARVDAAVKLVDKYATCRNDIAHGIVSTFEEFIEPKEGFRGWYLFPAFTSTKAMELPFRSPKYAYTSEIIIGFGQKFRSIRPEVGSLIGEIRKRARLATAD